MQSNIDEYPLLIEKARSNRSECGLCHNKIPKHDFRIGTTRFFFRRGPVVKWHHLDCALESSLVSLQQLNDKGIKITSNLLPIATSPNISFRKLSQMFTAAARIAIHRDIVDFRDKIFECANQRPFCPIKGCLLTRDSSHVHHSGPRNFNCILKEFMQGRDLSRISYTGNHFSSHMMSHVQDLNNY